MRAIVDLLDNLTTAVRALFALFLVCMMIFGYIMTHGTSRMASSAMDDAANSITETKELHANRAQERDLAEDGWGYDSSDPDNDWGAQ